MVLNFINKVEPEFEYNAKEGINFMEKEAIKKLQAFLLVWYKDFKEIEVDEDLLRLKEIAENGIASAIGAMELMNKM